MSGERRSLVGRFRDLLERSRVGPAPSSTGGRHIGARC